MKALQLPEGAELMRLYHGFMDDFNYFVTADLWTTVASNSGTVTVGDAAGGRITLAPSDCTVVDNDETYLKSTKETFKFAAGKPIIFEARVQFTEGATDDVNIIVGLKDAVAADSILDNGGGPAASYSGVVFFKVDGGTVWQCESSLAGTQTTTELTAANSLTGAAITAGGSADQTLRIEVRPKSSTKQDVLFWVDGVLVAHHVDMVYTNATEMQVCLGVKNGANTTAEALVADYAFCFQKR